MLADPRSKALVDNFAGQWLDLRSLRTATPDPDMFPDFDENLREAFQKEMELFLQSMLREDHSVLELLNANYTFVNERLARHYGIPNIYGSRFRRVTLADENRWGLAGQGSHPDGNLVSQQDLPGATRQMGAGKYPGHAATAPAPQRSSLDRKTRTPRSLTMRQRMEQHRANPVCAGCHARMDPIGFALENFDAIGKCANGPDRRRLERLLSYDHYHADRRFRASFPTALSFKVSRSFEKILRADPEQFVTTVTEKLLTYALGRGVEYYDEPAVRSDLCGKPLRTITAGRRSFSA